MCICASYSIVTSYVQCTFLGGGVSFHGAKLFPINICISFPPFSSHSFGSTWWRETRRKPESLPKWFRPDLNLPTLLPVVSLTGISQKRENSRKAQVKVTTLGLLV